MKIRVVNPTHSTPRRRNRRRAAQQTRGTGGVFTVAKEHKRRRRRRRMGNSHHRRRHNPSHYGYGRVKHRHRSRRRRNPSAIFSGIGAQLLWGTAGGVASLALPDLLVPSWNTGWTGILLNGVVAFGGGMLIEKMAGPKAGDDFKVGGLVAVGLKMFKMIFPNTNLGLSGDLGYYIENSFPLPTAGSGPYLLNPGYSGSPMASGTIQPAGLPAAAAAAAPLPTQAPDEPARWQSPWGA